MARAIRLAAGWAIALTAAILLNVLLTSPSAAPVADGVEPSRSEAAQPSPASSDGYPLDQVPPLSSHVPTDETRAGAFAPELAPVDARLAARLQAAVDRARRAHGLSALAVAVSIDGERAWAGASGLARDGVTPLDGHSPFAIASITKTFTGALVLQLAEERRLDLDAPVAPLLPELALDPAITVRQLLSHTSGVPDMLAPLRDALNADPERTWSTPQVMTRLGEPWFAPGTAYGYSNTNFLVLGLLVERVTGHPFADELERRLLGPLHLDDSGLLLTDGAPYLMRPAWASAFGTAGSMYASADDLRRWTDALYGGRVLQEPTRAQMLAFGRHDYGLAAQRIEVGGHAGYGHSGLLQGFTSLAVHLPEPGVTLVVMGTWSTFDPAQLLSWAPRGKASILDLALGQASP